MSWKARALSFLWMLWLVWAGMPPLLGAQSPSVSTSDPQDPYAELSSSLEKAIQAEKKDLEQLTKGLEELKQGQSTWARELQTARLQMSAVGNLVSLSSPSLEDLDKALGPLKQTVEDAVARVKALQEKQTDLDAQLKALAEQRAANQSRMESVKIRGDELPSSRTLSTQLKEADELFKQKEKRLKDSLAIYQKLMDDWSALRDESTALLDQLNKRIAERKREELFRRTRNPLLGLSGTQFRQDLDTAAALITQALQPRFWVDAGQGLWKAGGVLLVTSLLVFGVVEWLCFRFRNLCRAVLARKDGRDRPWFLLTMHLLSRSLPLLGATVFVHGYTSARDLYDTSVFLRSLCQILLLWLLSSWGIHFLEAVKENFRPDRFAFVVRRIRLLVSLGRWLFLAYVVVQESLGRSSALLLLYRFALESAFLAWNAVFWRELRGRLADGAPSWMAARPWVLHVGMGWGYGLALVGILLELVGYALLATLWYVGWGRSLIVGLWVFLFYKCLHEWEATMRTAAVFAPQAEKDTNGSFWWLTVKVLWVVWFFAGTVGILLAWGAKQALIVGFFHLLNTPVPLGNLNFRFLGLIHAGAILALTHVGSRCLKHFVKNRVFRHSGLEVGLQESIVSVAGYVLWFVGILAALNALGFSGTSLTVAFGALGVGLGFGLQNIFNNFISGLILLFERPIQVGDSIEIDGVWGEVRKINVRSTIIQTLDNASMIVPNSEFISSRVVNWSFKDLRIRRNINVGVAYGSDVELVRQTLLEVAQSHPLVYKQPEPSVLFVDFGDSALIFRLRVWTTVPVCLQVETDIRFEINRLFQERGIEIAFPQLDVHLKTASVTGGDGTPSFRGHPVEDATSRGDVHRVKDAGSLNER
ncbi:MAG: mechanosensitive ion channel domain-containing protein [Desulfosoma sp.]